MKAIRSFLGHATKFLKEFSKIARPLTKLLKKDAPFNFSILCIDSFNILEDKLIHAPIKISPDCNLPFKLMCDANNYAIGVVLG